MTLIDGSFYAFVSLQFTVREAVGILHHLEVETTTQLLQCK